MSPHGTTTRYNHGGCRCDACRKARYVSNVRLKMGQHIKVPAYPTTRRLQALACMGWGIDIIAERTGVSRESLHDHRQGQNVNIMPAVAAKIAAIYDELWDKTNPTKSSKTATIARQRGWSPPHPALLTKA